jgi:anaerobic nitric oxide reductase flavorubredoxin
VEFEGAPKEEDLSKVEAGVLELLEKMKDKVVD